MAPLARSILRDALALILSSSKGADVCIFHGAEQDVLGGLLESANRHLGFPMLKPENEDDWMRTQEAHVSFDQWRARLKSGSEPGRGTNG